MISRGLTSKESQRRLSLECKSLRDLVDKLRQDMLLCRNETQKVKDQLQCLIYLVKRAWSGDYIASLHVSNIVGVPPPKFKKTEPERLNVTPQPDPINNWAKLCIGVLNKMYREEELELRASQLMYLQDREGYLDDELACHGDIVRHQSNMALLKTNTFQLLQAKEEEKRKERQERLEQFEKQKHELQLQYQKKHPNRSHHLNKKTSQEWVLQAAEINTDGSLFSVKPVVKPGPQSQLKNKQRLNEHAKPSPSTTSQCRTTKPRAKSAGIEKSCITSSHPRPQTAHSAKPVTSTNRRLHIDLIERDLKLYKTLQDRLGISKEGMV